jgi:glycosyltransferase involved in cell wall biosynthesis
LDGVPANKLRLTVNGTLLPKSVPAIRHNELPVIGAVGRFIPEKDYPRLLLAMAELRGHGSRFRACIVGDGPEMTRVRDVVRELNLEETVELPGMVTDVGRWYRQFDIYVSASYREGQPLALLEAMAHGLPIVATNVGAAAETLCDGVGGLIVPPENTPALVNALGRLLSDSNLRESLARNARNRVETKFSIEAVADSHLQCYGELLSMKVGLQRNPVS